ncbi:hypothetical protein [Zooshikella harenae]|uniref:Uncharacterized protein n=1 Tax=Zooshikella harenae TaxID=2827238 RepID=A0ABS5ZJU8_9GAMM|nr:hypothetical protein [Zooshikella harenae]MBU2714302.1 hypothetical protein [Zooshikella harenae]
MNKTELFNLFFKRAFPMTLLQRLDSFNRTCRESIPGGLIAETCGKQFDKNNPAFVMPFLMYIELLLLLT